MTYRCANCGRSLVRQYAQQDGKTYGPVCAKKIGIKEFDPHHRPDKQKPTKHRRAADVFAQWGQLAFTF